MGEAVGEAVGEVVFVGLFVGEGVDRIGALVGAIVQILQYFLQSFGCFPVQSALEHTSPLSPHPGNRSAHASAHAIGGQRC